MYYDGNEALNDAAARRRYFGTMDAADFMTSLQQVGSVVRGGPADELQYFDGSRVSLAGHSVPDPTDKEPLLAQTWETARGFLNDPDMSDEDALTYAGLTVAGGIIYTHPFKDANGRTSRVFSHMMIEGNYDGAEVDIERMLRPGGGDQWSTSPPANLMKDYAHYRYDRAPGVPEQVVWEDDGHMDDILGNNFVSDDIITEVANGPASTRVLHRFARQLDERGRAMIGQHVRTTEDGTEVFDARSFLTDLMDLPEGGLTYAAQLQEAEKWGRADFVQRYLKAMRDSKHMEPARGYARKVERMHDEAETDPKAAIQVREFGRLAVGGMLRPRDHLRILHEAQSAIILERETGAAKQ
jgi:hypothetical protein